MSNTSAYVFPFRPFRNLERHEIRAQFTQRHVNFSLALDLVEKLVPPLPKIEGENWETCLINLFTHEKVLFGKAEWIKDLADYWCEKARLFVQANKPIEFTILGFPHKAPVALKTKRILPDFGELIMLKKLHELARAISTFHAAGAKIHIFAEGAFARTSQMPQQDADAYFAALEAMNKQAGYDKTLILYDTSRIADETSGFLAAWDEATAQIKARAEAGDEKTLAALRDSRPVTFHLNATHDLDEDTVRRVYLNEPQFADLRQDLERRTDEGVVRYRAFLEARDNVQLLENFAPGALGLTVSPRPGRLGVRPLPPPADILPYHGVPCLNEAKTQLTIEYRWDLLSEEASYVSIHIEGDPDSAPYLLIKA